MPVSFFDTLPLELQQRHLAAERRQEQVDAERKMRDQRLPREIEALEADWVGIGSKLGDEVEEARAFVLNQQDLSEGQDSVAAAAAVHDEVVSQHMQTKNVFATRKELDLKHMDARDPHMRLIKPIVIARTTPEELAEIVRKRLEKLGASIPAHKRPSTRRAERALHKLVHFCRANELMDKEDAVAALADYTVALRMAPDDLFALINRGNCYKVLRDWDKAVAEYSAAIKAATPPKDERAQHLLAYAHNNLGALYHDVDDYVAAFAEYTSALAYNPACHITWKNRASIYQATIQPSPDPQVPPPQHKLIFSDCLTATDQDWHEVKGFQRGEVSYNVEVRKVHNTYVAFFAVDLVRLPFRAGAAGQAGARPNGPGGNPPRSQGAHGAAQGARR
mmetsp:Transcript_1423/g.4122  ORF Transcript_1423/g.4122 Transcript_1423/m.4122 type:complete len:392 (+) Transcript_1423:23-1198(+)